MKKSILEEIREERKESPVETFVLLLALGFLVLCIVAFVAVLLYYITIPVLVFTGTVLVLWQVYQRI